MGLGRGLQQLRHRAHGPAAAGQLGVERGMAGGHDLCVGQAEFVGMPDAAARGGGKGVEEREAHDCNC
ncbi:hypothetical protein D9M69_690520 [compost metagenome]